jgi:hypothetical protein
MRMTLLAWFLISWGLLTLGKNQTVGSRDSRIIYSGTWIDQDNGGHQFAGDLSASASFTFTGTCHLLIT